MTDSTISYYYVHFRKLANQPIFTNGDALETYDLGNKIDDICMHIKK